MSQSKLALLGGEPVRQQPFPSWPQHDETEEKLLLEVLRSGLWWRYGGDKVKTFEERFAKMHDAQYGLAVSSGTTSLEASFTALDLQAGDEVLVPSYTFVATATAIILSGGTPVFVDTDVETLNIDLKHAETCITERTRAIVVVHFAGLPCDMEAVQAFASQHNLFVVEDCAHAHGAKWNGKGVGSHGDIAGFSFQISKNITSGEGGIVLTDNEQLLSRAFSRHTYGQRPGQPWYSHHVVSTNLRMTEWQGAILLAQLDRLDEQNARRLRNARRIDAAIDALPGLTRIGSDDPRAAERAYHLYTFRYAPGSEGVTRQRFAEALNAEGIPCSIGYPKPLYRQPLFENVQGSPDFPAYPHLNLPQSEQLCNEVIWLGQSVLLGDDADTDDIIRALEKVMSSGDALLPAAS